MKIVNCITKVDELKPNQFTDEQKVCWLSNLDATIKNEIIDTHEGGSDITFYPYTTDNTDIEMLVPFPYDELYVAFLKMKIDEENGEINKYNNSALSFNSLLDSFKSYYNRTYMPLQKNNLRYI